MCLGGMCGFEMSVGDIEAFADSGNSEEESVTLSWRRKFDRLNVEW
jgi:hypothetical protein